MACSKNIILHAGMNKTGSTALQRFYFDNKEILLKQGFLYPETGLEGIGHHNLAWSLGVGRKLRDNKQDNKAITYESLVKECNSSSAENIIISSEYFCIANEAQISEVKNLLSPVGNVSIIFVLRRQDKWIESLYAEAVKGLLAKVDIDTYYRKNRSQQLDYFETIEKWQNEFHKSVNVIPYAEMHFNIHNIISDKIGVDTKHFKALKNQNESLSPQALAVMRLLPRYDAFSQDEHERIIAVLKNIPFEKRKRSLLSNELRMEIMQKCESSNSLIENKYNNGDKLFSDFDIDTSWTRPDVLSKDDWHKLIACYDEAVSANDIATYIMKGLINKAD